jgi:hypothetical protein
MKNIIQFKYNFINLPQHNENNNLLAMSVVSELMQFGYVLDTDATKHLSCSKKEDIIQFHNEVITYLKDMTGSNRTYIPLWKGFPQECMDKSESELWLHQIIHYISCGKYEPSEFTEKRNIAFEQPKYTLITVGNEDRFCSIFTTLCSVNQSLPSTDLDIIKWFINTNQTLIFKDVPFKENLCTIIGELFTSCRTDFKYPILTVTDVLRIAVHLSGGNISLPKVPTKMIRTNAWSNRLSENQNRSKFKFKNFKRSERRFILSLLENTNCDVKEGVLKYNQFIRLGEKIHPMEFKNKYPNSYNFFYTLRNEKVTSWYGDLNAEFNKSLYFGVNKLSERSGEYVRRIDSLLRKNANTTLILDKFKSIADKASNKVLFELYTHFSKRNVITERSVMIKGARKRTPLPSHEPLDNSIIDSVQSTILDVLKNKFSTLDSIGKCYLSDELKNIPLPSNLRSLNPSLKPVIRGQRTKIGNIDTKVIRTFVHWFDEHSNEDMDLSATLIGKKREHISWNTNLKTAFGCHSGDVRHRQGACAEYIDLNIDVCTNLGFDYAIFIVNNFNGYKFSESKKPVTFGYMERQFQNSNEIFLPSTISNVTKLQSECTNTLVAILDIRTLEYIYLDIDFNGIPIATSNMNEVLSYISVYLDAPKFSLYDLMKIHIDTHGEHVEKENAEKVFDLEYFDSYVKILNFMGV